MTFDNSLCVEYVTFKLKAGADTEVFRRCSGALDASFLQHAAGFLSRRLLLLEDGETWADLVVWRDRTAAQAVEAKFMQDPVTQAYGNFIDTASLRMEHSREISYFKQRA